MTVHCRSCGREFSRDPAKEVPCPQCGADIGSPCRRPSEHRCSIHHARDRLALAVTDYGPCPESSGETSHEAARNLLEDEISLSGALEKLDETREDLQAIATAENPSTAQAEYTVDDDPGNRTGDLESQNKSSEDQRRTTIEGCQTDLHQFSRAEDSG